MPIQNLLIVAVILAVAALFLAFRDRIVGALKRFDERNVARRAEEARALFDGYSHYRQTVELARSKSRRSRSFVQPMREPASP